MIPLCLFSSKSCRHLISLLFLLFLHPAFSYSPCLLLFHVYPFAHSFPFLPTISETSQSLLLLQCCVPSSFPFHSAFSLCAPDVSCHAGSMIFPQHRLIWQLLSNFCCIFCWLSFRSSSSRRRSCGSPQSCRHSHSRTHCCTRYPQNPCMNKRKLAQPTNLDLFRWAHIGWHSWHVDSLENAIRLFQFLSVINRSIRRPQGWKLRSLHVVFVLVSNVNFPSNDCCGFGKQISTETC